MKQTINVLWTGGLDSTYLMFRLSQFDTEIQPYYIIDPLRKSTQMELKAIDLIATELKKHPDTKAEIHPVKIIKRKDIAPDTEIIQAWKYLHEHYELGTQYNFLARFARQQHLHLVVGVLFGERSKVENALRKPVELALEEGYNGMFLHAVSEDKSHPAYIVFENLYFPTFMKNLEKPKEWEYLKSHGAEKIAQMTWFCHRPVLGMTCGHCNPCKDALNEGMSFRVSKIGYLFGGIRLYKDKLQSIFK